MMSLVSALYLADIVKSVSITIGAIGCVATISAIIIAVMLFITKTERIDASCSGYRNASRHEKAMCKFYFYWLKVALATVVVTSVMGIMLPSRTVIYSYIGVEATKQLTKDPRIAKILSIVDSKLDELAKGDKNGK